MTDLISRQAAIDTVLTMFDRCDGDIDDYRDLLVESFKVLPSQERKTGKWIIQDNPGTGWYRVSCSECGEDVTSNIPMIGFFPHCEPLWDYCPYCGADMRGEGHE